MNSELNWEWKTMQLTHWGSSEFDPKEFSPVTNNPWNNKPSGGLWTSPTGCEANWRQWCLKNDFWTTKTEKSFHVLFQGNVATIRNSDDLLELLERFTSPLCITYSKTLDFEKMLKHGVDAIHLTEEGERKTAFIEHNLYGWSCETVLVMNPKAIWPQPWAIPMKAPSVKNLGKC